MRVFAYLRACEDGGQAAVEYLVVLGLVTLALTGIFWMLGRAAGAGFSTAAFIWSLPVP